MIVGSRPLAAVWPRAAFCMAVALIGASTPVLGLLRGQGVWLFVAAIVIGVPCVLAAEKKIISTETAREAQGIAWALIGMAIQCNSRFDIDLSLAYILRVCLLVAVLSIWAWIGRKFYSFLAPETEAERAQP